MNNHRIDIATIRKEQIVEAAVAVIAEQGLQNLSLSEIENKAGMKRGQLTYYFKHKEDILLAVFDRVLQLMYERLGKPPAPAKKASGPICAKHPSGRSGKWGLTPFLPGVDEQDCPKSGWEVTKYLLEAMLTKPPLSPEFHCLQYTFLSQIGYREDFRVRLATLYEEWRDNMAKGLAADLVHGNGRHKTPPRALATLIQALLHGLAMQAAADPEAFDGEEMFDLCIDMLGNYLGMPQTPAPSPRKAAAKTKPASHVRGKPTNGIPLASKG